MHDRPEQLSSVSPDPRKLLHKGNGACSGGLIGVVWLALHSRHYFGMVLFVEDKCELDAGSNEPRSC